MLTTEAHRNVIIMQKAIRVHDTSRAFLVTQHKVTAYL